MIEYTGGWELIPLSIFLIAGFVMIVFLSEGMVFVGVLILAGAMNILYLNHAKHLEEQFVLQSFNAGQSLKCGLWRGELTLINPHNGWRWEEGIGFVKNDQIIGDIDLCKVIAEEPPLPQTIAYLGIYLVLIAFLVSIRLLIQALIQKENKYDPDVE